MANNFIDVTEKWLKEAKPNMGNIEFSSYVISSANKEYDSTNSILNFEKDDSITCAKWFKNNIWGRCVFQPSIKYPQNIKTADLRLHDSCNLIEEKTIEIKVIGSSRKDGLIKRFKQAKGQSSNVLLDVTNYPYDESIVRSETKKYFVSHDWVKLVAVKKNSDLLFVWKKK